MKLKMSAGMVVLSMVMSVSALAANEKITFVDLQKALLEVNEGKKAKRDIEKRFTPKKAEIEKMEADLKKMKEDLEKKAAAMSPEAKQKKAMEFQEKMIAYQQTAQRAQMELGNSEREMTQPILENLKEVIRDYGEKTKVVVLEKNAVLYAPDEADVTLPIINEYNRRFKADDKK